MSQWHREHPELSGTDADPWMQHESYRRALEYVHRYHGAYVEAWESDDEPDSTEADAE